MQNPLPPAMPPRYGIKVEDEKQHEDEKIEDGKIEDETMKTNMR